MHCHRIRLSVARVDQVGITKMGNDHSTKSLQSLDQTPCGIYVNHSYYGLSVCPPLLRTQVFVMHVPSPGYDAGSVGLHVFSFLMWLVQISVFFVCLPNVKSLCICSWRLVYTTE